MYTVKNTQVYINRVYSVIFSAHVILVNFRLHRIVCDEVRNANHSFLQTKIKQDSLYFYSLLPETDFILQVPLSSSATVQLLTHP